jgi:hypothetical protein
VRLEEVVRVTSCPSELVESLLELGVLHPRPTLDNEPVIPIEEAHELRIAHVLLHDMGVNVAGVEIILHMRRRQIELQHRLDLLRVGFPIGLLPG